MNGHDPWDEDLCIDCFHTPSVHGLRGGESCNCCQSTRAIAAAEGAI